MPRKECLAHKTTTFDTPQAAKTKRMSDKSKGIQNAKPKIQSRGFSKQANSSKINKAAIDAASLPQRGGIARQYGNQ